jgi:diphosphomevalonate decarboxylase
MNNHFFAERRYAQAHLNALEIYHAMRSGDLERFGEIVEEEALTLHALMMMSSPSFILLKPATLAMIEKIRHFRTESKFPVYFTLDAGPNIHLLYPNSIAKEIALFIDQELKPLCENQFLIKDEVGQGLEIISKSF